MRRVVVGIIEIALFGSCLAGALCTAASDSDAKVARFADPGVDAGVIERLPDQGALQKIGQGKVLLHLTAYTGCSFCINSNPAIDSIAKSLDGSGVRVVRVAYEPWTQMSYSKLPEHFKINGIPAYIYLEDGVERWREGGFANERDLSQKLRRHGLPLRAASRTQKSNGAPRGERKSRSQPAELPSALVPLEQGAKAGDAQAAFDLAMKYANGDGVNWNADKAAEWFQAAARGNHLEAQYRLGSAYSDGIGVEQSGDEAATWLRRAAERGHVNAQYSLGMLYADGAIVSRDPADACFWLTVSGVTPGSVGALKRKEMESLLSTAERDRLRVRLEQWRQR